MDLEPYKNVRLSSVLALLIARYITPLGSHLKVIKIFKCTYKLLKIIFNYKSDAANE